jgi:uncharacterized protein
MSQVTIRGASLSAIAVAAVLFTGQVSAGTLDDARSAFAKEDYAAGMAKSQEAAAQGDPEAEALLGTMYLYGIGVPFDRKKALELNQKAAEQGRVDAQYNLYIEYRRESNENGVYGAERERIIADAMKWIRTAGVGVAAKAEEGDPIAQWVAGELKGIEGMLTKAADRGVVCAQFSLANRYEQRDPVKALDLYRKAAQAGHAGAEYRLAEILQRSGNNEESKRLYAKVALKGDSTASALLKRYYNTELGDPTEFYKFQAKMDELKQRQDLYKQGGGSAVFSYGAGAAVFSYGASAAMMGLLNAGGGGAGAVGSLPSVGRSSTNELVDRMRADQRQQDREQEVSQQRQIDETNQRANDEIQHGLNDYCASHGC